MATASSIGLALALLLAGSACLAGCGTARADASATPIVAPLPQRLSETGLYAPGSATEIAPGNLFYVPQYPLWSDGAAKRRWIAIPAGQHIDASSADAWQFPAGTRFWKEFAFDGKRTETRYIERLADGTYRYAAYVWNDAQRDAVLAPESGVAHAREIRVGVSHDVPSRTDCLSCHEGRPGRILGFNALQLSSELTELVRRGLVTGLPASVLSTAPRIPAPTPVARAAAGYLYGNCASCHNRTGPLAPLGLDLDQSVVDPASFAHMQSTVFDVASGYLIPGEVASKRVVPGKPSQSVVAFRMGSRQAAQQMPPLGSHLVDDEGLALVERWIAQSSTVGSHASH